ncbi:copper/zinc superoxide dismutase [Bordetella hinzii 5132]|uniref:superoxide dismutase family protein n=1 Tax=Bordetella hinzii TaxID=103855 RepID=UPI00045A4E4C|nr:superoxide dismutase family protein [Bordetella hinzii]KCB39611.1 copper/zinc superoxide dismutase [Bordetella hinzii 5132]QDJ44548.1 superoxide dismutase [Bordetella hinzii]QWF39674.1 superoxide dismutase family protein [Bordetella hinzii]QWF44221.1 superoxide dismutase family protein [Bordetella hinzii]QWF48757.1 superoxide dismutase family protein [Bordetella hinzii]
MKSLLQSALCAALLAAAAGAAAQTVDMYVDGPKGPQQKAGTIKIEQTKYGALLTPALEGLPPGVHGFHLHEKPSCDATMVDGKPVPMGGAGGHWDPDNTKAHKGPYDDSGHKGDLPALYVTADGKATYPVLAPRLKASDFPGHALMIHAGGDNHSDHPLPLGGGGGRIVCGIVK